MFAINVDPHNPSTYAHPDPILLYHAKFRGVRFTSRKDQTTYDYASACKQAGLKVCSIITGESQGYVLPQSDWIEFWNEPDVTATYRTPKWLADNYVLYRNTYPSFKWFASGFASGDPSYAKSFLNAIGGRAPLPDALSIHPYAKNTVQARELIIEYWNLTNKIPIVATEWYQSAASNEMWNFVNMLNNPVGGVCTWWNSYFCYSDSMVPGFGLVDSDGNPKPEYYSLLSSPNIP